MDVAISELREYLAPRAGERQLARGVVRLSVLALAIGAGLAEHSAWREPLVMASQSSGLLDNWAFLMVSLAVTVVVWRVAARALGPVTWLAAAEHLTLERSALGREHLVAAAEPTARAFRNPLASWWDVARLCVGDAPAVAALAVLVEVPVLLATEFGGSAREIAAGAALHVFAWAALVWAIAVLVDRLVLAVQLAVGLRQRDHASLAPLPSADPFWNNPGRVGDLKHAGTESFDVQ